MIGLFREVEIKQIVRIENYRADILVRMAAVADPKLSKSVPLEVRTSSSIGEEVEAIGWTLKDPGWIQFSHIFVMASYQWTKKQARSLKCQEAKYTLLYGVLYRWGFTLPLPRCLYDEDANYVLREIHEGICGNHSGARILALKALRQGYFRSTMHRDAKEMTRNCKVCQSFSDVLAQPSEKLTAMSSPWPFSQWGIDLIGPIPKG